MPLKTDDLSVLAFAKDFTLWHYRSPDTAIAEGYFDQADEMLASGDMILANLGQGADSRVGIYLLTGNAGGAISFYDLSSSADDFNDAPSEKPAPAVEKCPTCGQPVTRAA